MMTSGQFKKRSSIFMHRRKSPIIQDIDKLLKEYEKSTSENRKMKCLAYIYMMCKQYFIAKPNGRRGDAVQDLMNEVRLVLDSPEFQKQIGAKAGGRHYSGGKATDKMSTSGATATSLSKGYTWEGILPQKNFIAKMRLNMTSILGTDQKFFGASMVSQSIEQDLQMKGVPMDQAEKQAHELMGKLPFSQILDRLHLMWNSGLFTGDFNYLNSDQRMQYLLIVKTGQLYNHSSGGKFDTGTTWGNASRSSAFAMDCDERIYSTGDASGVGINWNHSSLLSGQPVICAGEITVRDGKLLSIDNNSGHYKPDVQNLADCVRALEYAGMNTQLFEVFDKSKNKKYATAAAFLALHR